MNTLTKVLIGAALVVGLAGLVVGLSNSAQIVNIAGNGANSLGAIASKWTNFAGSGVTTKVGYAITSGDDSTSTQFIIGSGLTPAGYPTILGGNIVQGAGGYGAAITTSTTLTAGQFCGTTAILIQGTTANITTTFPAVTSTYPICGGASGAFQFQLVDDNSTNTATFVPGTGMTFQCETQGVGTTTVIGGCVDGTSGSVTVNATSSVQATGYYTSSSTFTLMWGNEWH